jgi:hypothetical protein
MQGAIQMSEQKPKNYTTEWSFSFDKLGDSLNDLVNSIKISDEEVKKAQYAEVIGSATAAHIHLGLSVGEVNIQPAASADNLFEADITYVGELDYQVSGDADKQIHLGQRHMEGDIIKPVKDILNRLVKREDLRWTVGISPDLPIALTVDGGVGAARIDLSSLKLTSLKINGSVGETRLILPNTEASYAVSFDGGVGSTHITIAEGAAPKLKLNGGVGEVTLDVPENAAVHIEVNGGLGGVDFPERFARVKGGDDFISKSGVWETAGFALASQQITVHFNGGVGGLKVR